MSGFLVLRRRRRQKQQSTIMVALIIVIGILMTMGLTCHGFVVQIPTTSTFTSSHYAGQSKSTTKTITTSPTSIIVGDMNRPRRLFMALQSLSTGQITSTTTSTTNLADEEVKEEAPNRKNEDKQVNGGDGGDGVTILSAPLKFVGPYPCLGLRFPNLSTSTQKERNVTGISLDFVLDTAANTNTINGQVAQALNLSSIGQALPGVGSAGLITGGTTYELGDAQLENGKLVGISSSSTSSSEDDDGTIEEVKSDIVPITAQEEEASLSQSMSDDDNNNKQQQKQQSPPFTFLQGLTASALPIASPAAAGLLSWPFFQCFEGGVEFNWNDESSSSLSNALLLRQERNQLLDTTDNEFSGNTVIADDIDDDDHTKTPSVTFYGLEEQTGDDVVGRYLAENNNHWSRVEIQPLPVTQLPSITIRMNGVDMLALLDTGSPITILNQQAADQAGITTFNNNKKKNQQEQKKKPSFNPFAAVMDQFQSAQELSQAAARGEVLTIAGSNGQPTYLYKSTKPVTVEMPTTPHHLSLNDDDNIDNNDMDHHQDVVTFGPSSVYVGDIPGLTALKNGFGIESSTPAVVLGMDVLRTRPSMVLRARNNEVYFE